MLFRVVLVGLAVASLVGPAEAVEVSSVPSGDQGAAPPPKLRGSQPATSAEAAALVAPGGRSTEVNQPEGAAAVREKPVRAAYGGRRRTSLPPVRPEELGGGAARGSAADPVATGGIEAPPPGPVAELGRPETSTNWFGTLFGAPAAQPRGSLLPRLAGRAEIDALITQHARLNGVPEELVHRIVVRESKYNPRAVGQGGAMGLMQIKTGTARALGYQGGPAGLLDAETNITYAVKYLAGAYRTAGGNHDRAVGHYARGYYYEARRQGLIQTASRSERRSRRNSREQAVTTSPSDAQAAAATYSVANRSGDRSAR